MSRVAIRLAERRPNTGPRRAKRAGGQSAGKGPAGRYLRQREYPQPPPPSTSNTTRTINKVSMSHHLPPLSQRAHLSADIRSTTRPPALGRHLHFSRPSVACPVDLGPSRLPACVAASYTVLELATRRCRAAPRDLRAQSGRRAAQPLDEGVAIGGARPSLPGREDVDPAQLAWPGPGDLARAVGAGIVDDQDVGHRDRSAHAPEDLGDVVRLVVGREHDERVHARRPGPGLREAIQTRWRSDEPPPIAGSCRSSTPCHQRAHALVGTARRGPRTSSALSGLPQHGIAQMSCRSRAGALFASITAAGRSIMPIG